jgi:hypothetical protein
MSEIVKLLEQIEKAEEENRRLAKEFREMIVEEQIEEQREKVEMEERIEYLLSPFPSNFYDLEMGDEFVILLWTLEMKKDSEGKPVFRKCEYGSERIVWKNVFHKAIHCVMKPHSRETDRGFLANWVERGAVAAVIKKNN